MKESKRSYDLFLLINCLLAESAAFVLALLVRYVFLERFYSNKVREYDFYRMFYVVLLLMYSMIFFIRKRKTRRPWEQNIWEKLAEVLREQFILALGLTAFVFFIHWGERVSRTVLACLFVSGIPLDLIARRQYSRLLLKKHKIGTRERKVFLLAAAEELPRLKWCIERYGYRNEAKELWEICHVVGTSEAGRGKLKVPEGCDMIYLSGRAAEKLGDGKLKELEELGIPICLGMQSEGKELPGVMVVNEAGSAAVYHSLLSRHCDVLGVNYTTARRTEAAHYVLGHLKELGGKYICFSNVHTTVMAHDDPAYREVLNSSAYTFPDGGPVAGQIYGKGFPEAERMAGPDFMEDMFRMTMETGTKHFFYGSSEKTIAELKKKLKENYPFLQIAGMYSPPFREMTEEEDAEAVKMINDSGADLVWIGLGAPKQERWMRAHEGKIKGVMLGVGAGFDFHAGTIDRAPVFIQSIGLEWLYRMFQDPGRLVKRYLITNTKFIWYTKVKRKK